MKYKSIFICYSPSHILTGLALSGHDLDSVLFVLTPSLRAQVQKYLTISLHVHTLNIPSFTSSALLKIRAFFEILFYSGFECENLYIPNASHFFVCLLASCHQYIFLNYIDEGNTYLSLLRHHSLGLSQGPNRLYVSISRLLGLYIGSNIIDNPAFASHYVHNSGLLNSFLPDISFSPIPKLNILHFHSSTLLSSTHDSNSLLFISSPISENGWSEFESQEISLLLSFIRSYFPSLDTLVVKPHYRDRMSKFTQLNGAAYDVLLLDANIPLQVYSSSLSFRTVVSFHSSAIFSDFIGDPSIFSLSPLIDTPECVSLVEGLEDLLPFYPNLQLVRSFA